jgi:AraC family transcriptional regulator, positive regulator of tynA and feaB
MRRAAPGGNPGEDASGQEDAFFAAAKRLIDMRYGDAELTAAGIAAWLGCSRAHLYRVFAAHGATIADYLRMIRLEHARRLMTCGSRRKLAQIAAEVGYSDPASFSRAFRQRFGVSPGTLRRLRDNSAPVPGQKTSPETIDQTI